MNHFFFMDMYKKCSGNTRWGDADNRKKCFFVKRNPTVSEQRRNTKRYRCIFHHMQSMSQPNRSSPRVEMNVASPSIFSLN